MKVAQRLVPLVCCLVVGAYGCSDNSTPQGPVICAAGVVSCTTTSQCPADNTCVSNCCVAASGCATSADCSNPAMPHCDPGTNTCQPCASDAQCAVGKNCAPSGACLAGCNPANNGSDCPSGDKCHTTVNGGVCAQCASNSDCSAAAPICTASGSCFGCGTDSDCSATPATPTCSPTSHGCVACIDADNVNGVDPTCPSSAPACLNQACVACNPSANGATTTLNGACPSATPTCSSAPAPICVQCLVAANNATTGVNPACGSAAPVCNTNQTCVQCTATSQCLTGQSCGSDLLCHTPTLSAVCTGSTITCPSTATVLIGTMPTVAAQLNIPAVVATTVTFTLTAGGASFDPNNPVTTTTALVAAGSTTSAAVTVYLSQTSTLDVVVQASLGGVNQLGTIHITTLPAALSTFTIDQPNVQEGQAATLTVGLNANASAATTVTLTNDNPGTASIAGSVVIAANNTSATTAFTATALQSGSVTLHAAYSGVTLNLTVNVFKATPLSLTCANASVVTTGTDSCTVTLNAAVPAGASAIVALTGSGVGGTFPASVTVIGGASSATFTFTPGSTTGSETLTATAGGASAMTTLTITPAVTVMVVRVGDGTVALSSLLAPVFIEQHNLVDGGLLATLNLPATTTTAGDAGLLMTGNSTVEGGLSRSGDGRYVVLGGYNSDAGLDAGFGASADAGVINRVIGRIDGSGNIDTTTRLTSTFDKGNIRGAASTDGTNLWASGSNTGVVYTTFGTTSGGTIVSTDAGTPVNLRHIHVYDGQLYVTSASTAVDGVAAVGTGTPNTAAQPISLLNGFPDASTAAPPFDAGPNPVSFAVLDTDSTPGVDTIYEAQGTAPLAANELGVLKWSLNTTSGVWTLNQAFIPSITTSAGTFGLAAFADTGGTRVVAATTDGRLVTFLDDGSTSTPVATVLATAPTNTAYRGVAVSPSSP